MRDNRAMKTVILVLLALSLSNVAKADFWEGFGAGAEAGTQFKSGYDPSDDIWIEQTGYSATQEYYNDMRQTDSMFNSFDPSDSFNSYDSSGSSGGAPSQQDWDSLFSD
jgi:hypothetical protein